MAIVCPKTLILSAYFIFLSLLPPQAKALKPTPISGRTIRIGAFYNPEIIRTDDNKWTRSMVEYLDYLAVMGNFTLKFYAAHELRNNATEKWDKLRLAFFDGEVDLCGNVQTNWKFSESILLHPHVYEVVKGMYIVDLKHRYVGTEASKVFQMFTPWVWMTLLLCVVGRVCLNSLRRYYQGEEFVPSLGREFQHCIGVVTFQASAVEKKDALTMLEVLSFALPLSILIHLFSNLIFTSIVWYPGYFPPFTDLATLKESGFKFLIQERSNFGWNLQRIASDVNEDISRISVTKNDSEHKRIRYDRSELRKRKYIFDAWEVQTADCSYARASLNQKTNKIFPQDYKRKYFIPISPRLKPEIVSALEALNSRAFQYGMNIPIGRRRDQVYNLGKFYKSQNDFRCIWKERSRVFPVPYAQSGLAFFPSFLSTFLFWAVGLTGGFVSWCCERCWSKRGRTTEARETYTRCKLRKEMILKCWKYANVDETFVDPYFDKTLENLFRYVAMKSGKDVLHR